jgi:putative transposase
VSTYRRHYVEGGSYFFTVVSYKRQPVLTEEPVRVALREAIKEVRETLPFRVEAWVLLPDHLHCIWTLPKCDSNYSLRWARIKQGVSKRRANSTNPNLLSASRRKRGESSLWQRRFWEHQLRDEEDFAKHMNYIHYNPVKHGYAKSPKDYPYSTFHQCVKEGLYEITWGEEVRLKHDPGEVAN